MVTGPYDFVTVKETLAKAGFKSDIGEVNHEGQNEVVFTGDDAVKMQKLLDAFDAIDDVQDVYTSAVIED